MHCRMTFRSLYLSVLEKCKRRRRKNTARDISQHSVVRACTPGVQYAAIRGPTNNIQNSLDGTFKAVLASTDPCTLPVFSFQCPCLCPGRKMSEMKVLTPYSSARVVRLLLVDVIRDAPRLCVLHRPAPRVRVSVCPMMLLYAVGTCHLFRRQACSTPDWLCGVYRGGAMRTISKCSMFIKHRVFVIFFL